MSQRLAERLAQAWLSGDTLTEQEAQQLAPASFTEAYRVQQAVARRLNWFDDAGPQAWKLGGPPGGATAAPVARNLVQMPAAQAPVRLSSDDAFRFTALEFELAVRLGKPLEPGATLGEAKAAIAEVYLAIEVCDLRADNWQQLPASYRLADQQMSRGFILVDQPLPGWDERLVQVAPQLSLNARPLCSGPLQHPQGHPLASLPWLANLSGALYGKPLAAGTLIATGAWTGMHLLQPGDRFKAELDGLGRIEVGLDTPAHDAHPIRFRTLAQRLVSE